MHSPTPDRMLEKFNKQMDVFLKHEDLLVRQRQLHEQKLNNIFERNHQIEDREKSLHEQIHSQRYQNEQHKLQQAKVRQYNDSQRQKQEKRFAVSELWRLEQKQHEREIQERLQEIQQKIKYEEFKRKTDELINQLDFNLRKANQRYLNKQEKKEKYLNQYMNQKQETLNKSMQITEQHNQSVYGNYQDQMKRIQEICQRKVYAYQDKIKRINHMKQLQQQSITQKAMHNKDRMDSIKYRSYQIQENKQKHLQEKIAYFQDKIIQIENKRLQSLQMNGLAEQEENQRRSEARAKSENIYRNKSINMLNKQLEKEKSFQLVQMHNHQELSQRLERMSQKWQVQQSQVLKADQLKQSYLQQLEEKISQRDQRLQDQIQNKLDLQRRRLKVIEDMERQKRDLLLKLENDKLPTTNTSEMRYLYSTPKSKLFIT